MKKLMIALTAASVAVPMATASPASAQAWQRTSRWNTARNYDYNRPERGFNPYYADRYYRSGNYPERRLGRGDRIYRGHDGRYYCRRSDGTTGLIIGAVGGAALGNALRIGGSSTLSTILGGAAGAAIGSSIDRGNLRCR
jgi:hypothetical protein